MTLLGAPAFSMGSSSEPPIVDMSLDEMIASRRKKEESVAHRSIAKNRVRRQALMDAKRGITASSTTGVAAARANAKINKPDAMQVEKQVEKEKVKAAVMADAATRQKQKGRRNRRGPRSTAATGGGGAATAKATPQQRNEARQQARDQRQLVNKQKQQQQKQKQPNQKQPPTQPQTVVTGKAMATAPAGGTGRAPPKKAVNAAVNALEAAGYQVPDGMQMVISFAPKGGGGAAGGGTGNNQNKNNNNNKNGGGGRGGGRGPRRGGGGGGGGRGGKN